MRSIFALFIMSMITLSTLTFATPAEARGYGRHGGGWGHGGGHRGRHVRHRHWSRYFAYYPGPGFVLVYDPVLGDIWVPEIEVGVY